MAVRDDFAPGEVLAAADLNDTFAAKLPYSYGTATPTTDVDGFLWYDENSTPPAPKFWDGAAFQALGGAGKILQIVRATDGTTRTTTSTTYVDSNLAVTISPEKNDSALILIAVVWAESNGGAFCQLQITDSSNNAISGAEDIEYGQFANTVTRVLQTLFAYSTPATTSATTYKLRFSTTNATQNARLINGACTAQMYAIEVSA